MEEISLKWLETSFPARISPLKGVNRAHFTSQIITDVLELHW